MIKATRNQLAVANHKDQGWRRKVLCVCSAGILRSPTMARVLADEFDYNTRSCGTEEVFALIPISEALIEWADEIVFAEQYHMDAVMRQTDIPDEVDCKVLGLPDIYDFMEEPLQQLILEIYPNTSFC